MSEPDINKPTTMFWAVGVVALLWNLIGLWVYYTNVTATPETLSELYSDAQVEMILATPAWVTSATAIAVTAGVIGSILLLMQNRLSVLFFLVSLVAIVVQDVHVFGMTDSIDVFGKQALYLQAVVLAISVYLLWYSQRQKALGVLR
ncbi:MAG TPA: hypothetical protein PKK10_10110 [Woeseiaceae bacterium]|nr:hypothetical protein [Woeseiaceae bacterium]